MTFEWKHPNYYKELNKKFKELQSDENNQESENNKDKEPENPQE